MSAPRMLAVSRLVAAELTGGGAQGQHTIPAVGLAQFDLEPLWRLVAHAALDRPLPNMLLDRFATRRPIRRDLRLSIRAIDRPDVVAKIPSAITSLTFHLLAPSPATSVNPPANEAKLNHSNSGTSHAAARGMRRA